MRVTVSDIYQIVLPAEFRAQDNILAGQQFNIARIANGRYLLTRRRSKQNAGLVKLLLACPSKGWFQPLDRSQSTEDALPLAFE